MKEISDSVILSIHPPGFLDPTVIDKFFKTTLPIHHSHPSFLPHYALTMDTQALTFLVSHMLYEHTCTHPPTYSPPHIHTRVYCILGPSVLEVPGSRNWVIWVCSVLQCLTWQKLKQSTFHPLPSQSLTGPLRHKMGLTLEELETIPWHSAHSPHVQTATQKTSSPLPSDNTGIWILIK